MRCGAEILEFRVPYQRAMRVLDALNWIAENEALDLAYRWFCGSKMCGTCAVRMNGREVLACWEADGSFFPAMYLATID
jgi:succinate dehydrogenase/fumarate reductase-like Fe-S protein